MPKLRGKVAIVTGASRGVGKGIALGLGEAGATVYLTGRTVEQERSDVSETLQDVAESVSRLGGRGIPVRCNHRHEEQVCQAVERIIAQEGRVDILVNNVWGGYEKMIHDKSSTWAYPFWLQPLWRWDDMFQAGVRAYFVTSRCVAPTMIAQQRGLIVNISYWSAQKYLGNVIYGVAKAAADKMIADMAHELREHNVAAVSLYPGLVRTERVMQAAEAFDLGHSESPQLQGRAVAALAADPDIMEKTGKVLITSALAQEYHFTDIDGTQPRLFSLDDV